MMKLIPIITGLCMWSQIIMAQNKLHVDSLTHLLQKRTSTDSLTALIPLSLEYFDVDNKLALQFAELAYQLSNKYGDSAKIVKSGRLMGQLLRRLDRVEESIAILEKVRPIADRLKLSFEYERILNALAFAYTLTAQYDKALSYHFQALARRQKNRNKSDMSTSLINIGWIYFKLTDFKKAEKYYAQSLMLKKQIKDSFDLDRLMINLSLCYIQIGDLKKAKNYLHEAFKICGSPCSNIIMTEGEFATGMIHWQLNDLDSAKIHFLKSYTIALETGNERFQIENIIYISKICLKQNVTSLAKKYLMKAKELKSITAYNTLQADLYKQFAAFYNQIHEFKQAAMYQGKYIQLRDSLYGTEQTQKLMVVQADYEQRENKARIATQNHILLLKDDVINKQNSLGALAGLALLLMLTLVTVLYRNNLQKKRINQLLEQKVKERTKELEQSYRTLQQTHQEQTRLVSKTSNDIKSPLNTMKGLCSLALKELQGAAAQEYFVQINVTTEYISDLIGRLSLDMK